MENKNIVYHLKKSDKRLKRCWNKPVSQWRKLFPLMEREIYIAQSKPDKEES